MRPKYIEPIHVEIWLRSQQKSIKGASSICKAIINAFSVVENRLAWKIGNGQRFRLGKDPWPSSERQHLLSDQLIQHLHTLGIVSLNNLVDPRLTTLWSQGWKEANKLRLSEDDTIELERYINFLNISQIRLRDCENELIWDSAPSGTYTPKLGYLKLNSDMGQRETIWWWGKLWKIKNPAKTRLFMWNVLNNKVPTWDILQKRNFSGPGWCTLCKSEGENIVHLFLNCNYINKVWTVVSSLLDLHYSWSGQDLEHAWKS